MLVFVVFVLLVGSADTSWGLLLRESDEAATPEPVEVRPARVRRSAKE